MQRLNLILLMILAVACLGYAQKSGSTGAVSGGTAATMPANGGTTTPGSTTPSIGRATETPMAPTNPTTVNPGNPGAPTGGSPIVPSSAVPTVNSNSTLQNAVNNGVIGNGGAGTGQVVQSFHLETQTSGAETAVPNAPGTGSPILSQPNANADLATGPEMVTPGDLAGMTYAGAVGAPAGASANQPQAAQVDNRSLGEIAAVYKRAHATQNSRVFTNDDVQRLNARNDVNVMGPNNNTALPQGETATPPQVQQQQAPQKRSPFTPKQ
jgi:hypothetical protein